MSEASPRADVLAAQVPSFEPTEPLADDALEGADPISVAALRRSVLAELRRRMDDPAAVGELSATGLLSFAKELVRGMPPEPETLPPNPTVREIVEAANVPAERKRELLAAEIRWLADETKRVEKALDKLKKATAAA